MSQLDFYVRVIRTLEEMDAPFMLVGAFAGLSFGISRATFDVDMVVDLKPHHAALLAEQFPPPRYYADAEMIRSSMEQQVMFNLIDTEEGTKRDMVPLGLEPGYRLALSRRVRRQVVDDAGATFEAWIAQPSDIIVGKLQAWTERQSDKHPADIRQMLAHDMAGTDNLKIDYEFVAGQAERMGTRTLLLWQELVKRAKMDLNRE